MEDDRFFPLVWPAIAFIVGPMFGTAARGSGRAEPLGPGLIRRGVLVGDLGAEVA
jgi:hypothetical protein